MKSEAVDRFAPVLGVLRGRVPLGGGFVVDRQQLTRILRKHLNHNHLYSTPVYSTHLNSTPLYSTHLYSTHLNSTPLYSTHLYSTHLYSTHLQSILIYRFLCCHQNLKREK